MIQPYKAATFVHGGPSTIKETCTIAGVGEQPGIQEIRRNPPKVFVGPAGQEMDDCFRLAKINRPEVYMTNFIKDLDKPLAKYINLYPTKAQANTPDGVYLSDEARYYLDYLRNELSSCSANVILAIGAQALYALTNRKGITNWRGSIIESTLLPGRKVIPCFHPATVIPPKNQYLNKHLIVMDLLRVREQSAFPEIRGEERNLIEKPTFYQVLEHLEACRVNGLAGCFINFDIEVMNEEISCVSFSWDEFNSMSIPFVDHTGDYFTLEQETAIWLAIATVLEDERIKKLNHNIGFDIHFKLARYGIKTKNVYDTMIAQKILFPDYFVRLEFPTTMYTEVPFYKRDEGKKWTKIYGRWPEFWRYNNMDSIVPQIIFPKQERDLVRQGNLETFEEQNKLTEPLVYMQERGIRVDQEGMKKAFYETESGMKEVYEEIKSIVGYEINPDSPKQWMHYFYVEKGIEPYKKRNSKGQWVWTADEDAMVRLARKGHKVAQLCLDYRRLGKRKGTYLPVVDGKLRKVSPDGRMRCSYNAAGTVTGRLSSSEDIFGFGMDLQNWPHDLLSFLLADEGYVYYAYDLAQIENRIVAYVGNITQMIDAFESGIDLHKQTAALIFRIPYDEVSNEDGSCHLGGGKYSQRFWGKKGNHSLNYDYGYKMFSLKHEITETEGKFLVESYHNGYPGVRENYQAMVRIQLRKDRTLTNLLGRKRLFLNSITGQGADKTFKTAYAQIPQSTTADKITRHGLNYIYYNQNQFDPLELLIQIHDSIGFQIPLSTPWPEHARMLWSIKESLETPLATQEREFIVPVDLTMGMTLNKDDGAEIKAKDFPTSVEKLADKLKENWDELNRNLLDI